MRLLIIGAGLVGSQVAWLEVERGEQPIVMDVNPQMDALEDILHPRSVKILRGDVLNPLDIVRVIHDEKITHIIHTAANPMLTPGAQQNPYFAIQLNIMGTVNVFEAARSLDVERVVYSSSAVLYHYLTGGEDSGARGKEEAWPRTDTFYASSKLATENLGLNYAKWCDLDTVAVRYCAAFGPWKGKGGGGPTTGLFRGMVERPLRGEEVVLPARRSEFVYSKDAALGTMLACHATNLKNRVFNIGMGEVWDMEDIGSMLQGVIPGARIQVEEQTPASGSTQPKMVEPMDLSRSREQLGYEPQFPMAKALADYVAWFKRVYLA